MNIETEPTVIPYAIATSSDKSVIRNACRGALEEKGCSLDVGDRAEMLATTAAIVETEVADPTRDDGHKLTARRVRGLNRDGSIYCRHVGHASLGDHLQHLVNFDVKRVPGLKWQIAPVS